MSDQDPKRLFDDLRSGELKDLLAAGKSETPSEHQMIALAAKIGIAGGLGGLGGAGAAGAGGGGAGAGAGAGAKGAVVAGAVKGGLAVKVVGAVVIASAVGAGAVAVTSNRAHVDDTKPAGMVASAPVTTTMTSHTATASLPARPDPFASTSTAPATTKPTASAPAKAEDEVKMLERAQDALQTRPAEALAICNEHARAYPNGMLAQEREVIAIEALVKTGRRDEARARAERFKTRWPGSSHTRRIDSILGP